MGELGLVLLIAEQQGEREIMARSWSEYYDEIHQTDKSFAGELMGHTGEHHQCVCVCVFVCMAKGATMVMLCVCVLFVA